jgi:cardiolipin-specific phospholipase
LYQDKQPDFPIVFVFGESDWMDPKGARNLSKIHQNKIELIILKECGHQINMDNPRGTVKLIFDKCEKYVFN